jgi:transposase-like protein
MNKTKKQSFTNAFKAKFAMAAIKGDKTIPQLADEFNVHPTQINNWKKQFLENASSVFDSKPNNTEKIDPKLIDRLHAKTGELTLENDFLEKALNR